MKMKYFCLGLFALFVVNGLVSSSYASAGLSNCVGMWLFDEGDGDETADGSGNGNDGTLLNAPQWTEGKFGDALLFDGSDDCVEIEDTDDLSITGDLTFSIWIKVEEYPTSWRNMLSKLVDDTHAEFNFRHKNSTQAQFYFGDGAGARVCNWNPSEDLPLDEWTHVAGVRRSKTYLKLYFNGVEKRSLNITTDPVATDANVTIGRQSNNVFFFKGAIDEVALFNAELDEGDIKNIMKNGLKETLSAVEFSGKLVSTWAALRK
jgi:hypothetical protein